MTPEQWIAKRKEFLETEHAQLVDRLNDGSVAFDKQHKRTLRKSRNAILVFTAMVAIVALAFYKENRFGVTVMVSWLATVVALRYLIIVRSGKKAEKQINDLTNKLVEVSGRWVQKELRKLDKLSKEVEEKNAGTLRSTPDSGEGQQTL